MTVYPTDLAPTRKDLDIAVAAYWLGKAHQRAAAEAVSSTAEGTSKAVRGGGHFNPIANLIARFFTDAGYPPESIHASGAGVRLPGYYRPTKAWDLVVVHEGVLVAAMELKALGGPSFGNNYNNRVEEALGNAVDVDRANFTKLVGSEPPWLGYFFLMEDQDGSRQKAGKPRAMSFEQGPEWLGRSYQGRFELTGQRLLEQKLYDAVCYVTSSPENPLPIEPSPRLDWKHFSAAINARIRYLSDLGCP